MVSINMYDVWHAGKRHQREKHQKESDYNLGRSASAKIRLQIFYLITNPLRISHCYIGFVFKEGRVYIYYVQLNFAYLQHKSLLTDWQMPSAALSEYTGDPSNFLKAYSNDRSIKLVSNIMVAVCDWLTKLLQTFNS